MLAVLLQCDLRFVFETLEEEVQEEAFGLLATLMQAATDADPRLHLPLPVSKHGPVYALVKWCYMCYKKASLLPLSTGLPLKLRLLSYYATIPLKPVFCHLIISNALNGTSFSSQDLPPTDLKRKLQEAAQALLLRIERDISTPVFEPIHQRLLQQSAETRAKRTLTKTVHFSFVFNHSVLPSWIQPPVPKNGLLPMTRNKHEK